MNRRPWCFAATLCFDGHHLSRGDRQEVHTGTAAWTVLLSSYRSFETVGAWKSLCLGQHGRHLPRRLTLGREEASPWGPVLPTDTWPGVDAGQGSPSGPELVALASSVPPPCQGHCPHVPGESWVIRDPGVGPCSVPDLGRLRPPSVLSFLIYEGGRGPDDLGKSPLSLLSSLRGSIG